MCCKALSNSSPFTVGLQELHSQGALFSPLYPWEPRGAPHTRALCLTPPRLCSWYPLLEWPFPALYSSGNLLPFFMTRLKCSFFRVAFPTCPHSLGQQILVEGPRSQVLMSQKPTVRATLRDTMRGHLETRKRYQGGSVDVLNMLVEGDSKCWWNERDAPGWVSDSLGTQGSHGALLGASESQIHGKISCSVTRNVTPTGQRAWLLMLPRPGEDEALD